MATHAEIQDYVKSKYRYTPKTCWIAHMKELTGQEVGRAPNRQGAAGYILAHWISAPTSWRHSGTSACCQQVFACRHDPDTLGARGLEQVDRPALMLAG